MSGFGIDHLPYGVFSVAGGERRVGVRLDDAVVDLSELTGRPEFAQPSLNAFLGLGPEVWRQTREELTERVPDAPSVPVDDVVLHLPFEVADYVDFYASEHHATNVGRMFRPDQEPLLPNWKHLPVAYHGRAGTVVVSGTPVVRPQGQRPGGASYGPTERLDIEAELGFVVGAPSPLGTPVAYDAFGDHVFGVVGLNDWSARDVQAWEYVPLGPFLGKSFATSVGAWVTPLAALDAAWCDLPGQDPEPLPHLLPAVGPPRGLDIEVEVELDGEVVSRPPYRTTYWGPAQMLAHLTSNGASLRTGDLFASGTISGPAEDQRGSFLELWWGERFLADGAEVVLRYTAPSTSGARLSLGEVRGRVEPART
ncbi:fumarylacetoacetate hydrolase family protein [Nocardioides lianchengensis]|uniref:fumarylacetoacetase n=1 Tax=Nocardioides lianchengensis TaxID=1045774 RepID=A0A1G6TUK3_9ACTN|nr:fumarylacetoacetate hydrolase family protein [Nocardioides lianchengensis]NYG11656.1 fumarylacetoacetase [Nocardioides lianchengensis]SDD32057.1 fumarylacetoacetase [Nocardioides lianchengensis]